MISCLYEKGLFDIFRGNQFHLILWVISYQGINDQSNFDERKPEGLTIYKPGDQIFQKLHLSEYLRELYEVAENESEDAAEKKKDFLCHLHKECE
jgi:hypothetical protein